MAKLCEQAERYDTMGRHMTDVAKVRPLQLDIYVHECRRALTLFPALCQLDVDLTVNERNLLSVAYKNVIGAKRAAVHPFSAVHVSHNHTSENAIYIIITVQICQTASVCGAVADRLVHRPERREQGPQQRGHQMIRF